MSEQRVLDGKVALVTGAGSAIGLGRAMAVALAQAGARVAMTDVDATSLEDGVAALERIGGTGCVVPIVADATRPDDAERTVERTVAELGGLHVLINNAGINPQATIWDIPVDAWVRTVATNLTGPFLMARAAAPYLRQQGWGRIIGVTTSLDTMLRTMPYGPAKAGHEAFMAVLASQLEGTGVTANILVPGRAVATNMTRNSLGDGLLQPEVMQAPAVWLASEASNGFHGKRIVAEFWNETEPIDKRLAKTSAPIGWPQLGRQAMRTV